jgi:hypothetical protein
MMMGNNYRLAPTEMSTAGKGAGLRPAFPRPCIFPDIQGSIIIRPLAQAGGQFIELKFQLTAVHSITPRWHANRSLHGTAGAE